MLCPVLKMRLFGPRAEENLAIIQTIFGENSRAISTLTRCYKRPMGAGFTGPNAHYAGPS